jgi:hypothetical protein
MQYFIMRLNVGLCEVWSPMHVYVKLNVATWTMLNVSLCDEDECKFMCPKVKSKTLLACQSIFVGLMFDAKMFGL